LRAAILLLSSLALLAACTVESQREPAWSRVPVDALSADQQAQMARAEQGRDALFGALGGELQQALAAGTPVEAITVCKDAAPRIAAEVAAAQGLAIGRTSQRLRNPANTPPAWAAGYVASAAEEPACFAGPEGELGVLLPIRTMPVCATCHGPADALDAQVAAALAAEYPQDQAVGYGEGQLRGWFWVEVGS
jgi:hypothetical protein